MKRVENLLYVYFPIHEYLQTVHSISTEMRNKKTKIKRKQIKNVSNQWAEIVYDRIWNETE